MDLNLDAPPRVGHVVTRRLPGPDVVRAVALIGVVVMNYHGYLILLDGGTTSAIGTGWAADLFDPSRGPLSTRFAATFVLVAGVGVTLLTRSTISDAERVTEMRWRLVRRGVLLYIVGLALDVIWPGTIIPYYGAMFVVAAVIFTWRSWLIGAIGVAAAIGGTLTETWLFRRAEDGRDTGWLTSPEPGSVRGYLFNLVVNGTHPLLPWLGFLCAGMLLGRLLVTNWWRVAAFATGATLFVAAAMLASAATTPFQRVVLSTRPSDSGLVYVASALGTALVAYAGIDWLAERFPTATEPLRRAGQMTLTLYLAHVFVFKLVVDWTSAIEPAGLDVALLFAGAFWVAAIIAAAAWQRRYGIGPAERVYRAFGG